MSIYKRRKRLTGKRATGGSDLTCTHAQSTDLSRPRANILIDTDGGTTKTVNAEVRRKMGTHSVHPRRYTNVTYIAVELSHSPELERAGKWWTSAFQILYIYIQILYIYIYIYTRIFIIQLIPIERSIRSSFFRNAPLYFYSLFLSIYIYIYLFLSHFLELLTEIPSAALDSHFNDATVRLKCHSPSFLCSLLLSEPSESFRTRLLLVVPRRRSLPSTWGLCNARHPRARRATRFSI